MILEETYTLANGVKIPKFALGTWFIDNDEVATAVRAATEIGYRHFDTAQAYGNEAGVGEGVRTCGIARDQLFVTSKVAAEHKDYDSARASIDETLEKTGLDYLDLMIIHGPQPWKVANQSDDRYLEGNREAWWALEDTYSAGKVRAIGVSNFLKDDLQNIMDHARIMPMVDQVLAHIGNTPFELMEFCKANDVQVEAFAPIAHGEALKNPAIAAVADKYGVTVPQICLRYDLQLDLVVLPKTANPAHMASNAQVDFVISDEDMEALKQVRNEGYGEFSNWPVFGGRH